MRQIEVVLPGMFEDNFENKGFGIKKGLPLTFLLREGEGFSLIEILITVAVIAVLVGIGIPFFKKAMPIFGLSTTARNLVTDLRYAQQLAVGEQNNYGLQFSLAERKYSIVEIDSAEVISEQFFPDEIQNIVVYGFTGDLIEFNPYGAVRETGTIFLEDTLNNEKTIEIKPSGFVKVF